MKLFNCPINNGKMNAPKIVGLVALGLIGATGLITGVSAIVKALWNGLMPEIFGLKKITLLQALGLTVLTKILFTAGGHSHTHSGGGSKTKTKIIKKEVEIEKEPEVTEEVKVEATPDSTM